MSGAAVVILLSVLLVAPVLVLVLRKGPGRLSATWRHQGTRRFTPEERPAGPDAEAMGIGGDGRISSDPEAEQARPSSDHPSDDDEAVGDSDEASTRSDR